MCLQVCDCEQDTHNWRDASLCLPQWNLIRVVAAPASIWMLNVSDDDTIRENVETCTYERNMWLWFIELSLRCVVQLWKDFTNARWESVFRFPIDGMRACSGMGKYAFLWCVCMCVSFTNIDLSFTVIFQPRVNQNKVCFMGLSCFIICHLIFNT